MNTRVTIFLPRIWKNAPTMLPLDFPSSISRISHIWNNCTPLKMLTSMLISDPRKASLSTKRGTPTASSKYDHTAKLATLTALSMSILIRLCTTILLFQFAMTRGNQREIDRQRAQKRNADKDKKDQKSQFFKTKDSNAEIMRLKQKKFQEQQEGAKEEEQEKPGKSYKEDYQ